MTPNPTPKTRNAPQSRAGWYIDDPIVRLRYWGAEREHALPMPPVSLRLGSSSRCEVQLCDPEELVSREHAELAPEEMGTVHVGWKIRDLGSTNGLRVNGKSTREARLEPGSTIELGGLKLIAESERWIDLYALIGRFLGWSNARHLDEALWNIRDCATSRTPLVLRGEGDLKPVVRRLQLRTLGPSAPIVFWQRGDAASALKTAQKVSDGTLCISQVHPRLVTPKLVSAIADAVQNIKCSIRPHLVVCADKTVFSLDLKNSGRWTVIDIPNLKNRGTEVPVVVQETARDVAREFGTDTKILNQSDWAVLGEAAFNGFAKLEDAAKRIVLIRIWGVGPAAKRLGRQAQSLYKWARYRGISVSK